MNTENELENENEIENNNDVSVVSVTEQNEKAAYVNHADIMNAPVTDRDETPRSTYGPAPVPVSAAAAGNNSKGAENRNTNNNKSGDNTSGYQPMDHVVRAKLAIIRENTKTGWKRLLTITQWGGGKFKLDIRDWNREMTRATKGMTFTRTEAKKLRDVLAVLDLSIIDDYQQSEGSNYNTENNDTMLKAV